MEPKSVMADQEIDRKAIRQHPLPAAGDCRVAFVQFTAEPSGSPLSGLLIAQALRSRQWPVEAIFGRPGACSNLYANAGCGVHDLRHGDWLTADRWYRQGRNWLRERHAARAFTDLFRARPPRIVYINNVTGAAAAVAARRLRIPVVWHIRELFDDVGGEVRIPPIGGKRIVRWMLRQADHIVTVSQAVRANVVGDVGSVPVSVVPNAAFARFFQEERTQAECRGLLGLQPDGPLIGVPGTLRPMKGHRFFLEAARQVLGKHPQCRFAITGAGPSQYRAELEASIQGSPLERSVTFLGNVDDMAAFYRACDVICVPSRSDPCPRAAIEPLAIGTPVIGSDVGGISETIDEGTTGFLVPYGDAGMLATRINHLIDNSTLRTSMAAAARAKAETHYREDLYQDRILSIIDSVLEKRQRHG